MAGATLPSSGTRAARTKGSILPRPSPGGRLARLSRLPHQPAVGTERGRRGSSWGLQAQPRAWGLEALTEAGLGQVGTKGLCWEERPADGKPSWKMQLRLWGLAGRAVGAENGALCACPLHEPRGAQGARLRPATRSLPEPGLPWLGPAVRLGERPWGPQRW